MSASLEKEVGTPGHATSYNHVFFFVSLACVSVCVCLVFFVCGGEGGDGELGELALPPGRPTHTS